MIYRKKASLVQAMLVKDLVHLAKSNFDQLPLWVRKKFRTEKIFVGISRAVVITSDGYQEKANQTDYIVLTEDSKFKLMTDENFKLEYEAHSEISEK